jgi:hypothetical protein
MSAAFHWSPATGLIVAAAALAVLAGGAWTVVWFLSHSD